MKELDWQRLVRDHDEAPEHDDTEWLAALEAMDEDPNERQRAIEADPLLMFRRQPVAEATGSEIDAMKAAVDSLRRASALEAEHPARRPVAGWPLAALLALGVSAALLTGPDVSEVGAPAATVALQVAPDVSAPAISLAARELPLVEDADPASDLLMQIDDDDLSLVVVLTGDQGV